MSGWGDTKGWALIWVCRDTFGNLSASGSTEFETEDLARIAAEKLKGEGKISTHIVRTRA